MQLNEVLHSRSNFIHPLMIECSMYLEESRGLPLLKNLPSSYKDFQKIKVRKRKKSDSFTKTFNEAFDEIPELRQRAIFANGEKTFKLSESAGYEAFYIFPIDGYKFKYSIEVTNSKEDYQEAFVTIVEQIGDDNIIEQLLKYTYTSTNLHEGISRGAEIIFYGIPYYYAVRANTITNYSDFIKSLS